MKRVIFNPEHDLCLADGSTSFIPPAAIVEFAAKCSWIERFMSESDQADVPLEIIPWGWNRCLRDRLLKEGIGAEFLPDDSQLNFIRENSRRELAVELLERLGYIFPATYRIVAHTMEEIEAFIQKEGRVVLKAPLSGSGKGVRFIAEGMMESDIGWCRRILQRQGAVVVEQRMEIVKEFAMLFECDDQIRFKGYSLFYAANGAYKGNLLASNEHIENILGNFLAVGQLVQVREQIMEFLIEKLQGRYKGFIGVDQFVAKDQSGGGYCWNPAMEINLRMTMGLIARNIYDYHAKEFGLGDGTHCFEPERGIQMV